MAKEQKKKSEIVKKDDSTIIQKYNALNRARIAKKTRNTFRQTILTLKDDWEYIRLLLKPKYKYSTRTENNPVYKQKVMTDYFKDNEKNLYVMQSNYSLNQHVTLVGKKLKLYPDMSVAIYVAINDEVRDENGKNNTQIKTSESILLSRFDPGHAKHDNRYIEENPLKLAYFGKVINSGVPHFHYASKTQAEKYGDTAECDAISLDNLMIL